MYLFPQVLVVANPANTNALILKEFAPSIPEKNITCLTRLDHNRALGQVSERLSVQVSDVKNCIIWGNHSSSQYPDVNHATVKTPAGDKPVRELVADDQWYCICLMKFQFRCIAFIMKFIFICNSLTLLYFQVEYRVHFNCPAAWCCHYQG